jgi:hypothetical protein
MSFPGVDSHLRCQDCGATWLSDLVRNMAARNEGCLVCDGALRLVKGAPDTPGPTPRRSRLSRSVGRQGAKALRGEPGAAGTAEE